MNFKRTDRNPSEYNLDPRCVAIGDFNNDKFLDIVVTNRAVNNISIFIAYENTTFRKPTTYSTGHNSLPNTVAVNHLNNDRHLDIIVAYFGINSIGIFFGLGDGSFINHTTISTKSSRPIWLHIAHLDNDIFLDLVTADYGTDSITIFSGDGTGNFSYRMRYSTGYDSFPVSVISADLNNDHRQDLAVANSGTNNVGIFYGQDNGEFSDEKILSTGIDSHPNSITIGYLNEDHFLDIAVANSGSNTTGILMNRGNGIFDNQISYPFADASPYFIMGVDFTNDNRMDLVVINRGSNNIGLLSNNGNESFSQAILFSTGSSFSISAAQGDLNNHGNKVDIVVINNDLNSITILSTRFNGLQSKRDYVTINVPPFYLRKKRSYDHFEYPSITNERIGRATEDLCPNTSPDKFSYGPSAVAVGDLNNDTYLDIVVTLPYYNIIGVFLGYGNGSFASQKSYSGNFLVNFFDWSDSITIGDFNNDDILDVIYLMGQNPSLTLALGNGNGSFVKPFINLWSISMCSLIVCDINNDNQLDLVGVTCNVKSIELFLGYGNGSFGEKRIFNTLSSPNSVAVADMNNDTRMDLIIANYADNEVGILLGYGNGSFVNVETYPSNGFCTLVI